MMRGASSSTMPHDRMHIVDNRDHNVDICVQHLAALALFEGTDGLRYTHTTKSA